jgi:hypothetical protein
MHPHKDKISWIVQVFNKYDRKTKAPKLTLEMFHKRHTSYVFLNAYEVYLKPSRSLSINNTMAVS